MAEKIRSEESDSSETNESRGGHFAAGEVRDKQASHSSSRKRQSTQGNKSHKARRRKVKAATSSGNDSSGSEVRDKQPSQSSSRKRQSTQGNKSYKDKKKKTDYSKISASDIVERFGKEKLIEECEKLMHKNEARIPLLEARNLINRHCRGIIEAKLKQGESFLAATELVEFLAENHDGNKMEKFYVFVKNQAGKSSVQLLNFAKKLHKSIVHVASARGEGKGQVSTSSGSDDSSGDEGGKSKRGQVSVSSDSDDSSGDKGCDVRGKQSSHPSSRKRQSLYAKKSFKSHSRKDEVPTSSDSDSSSGDEVKAALESHHSYLRKNLRVDNELAAKLYGWSPQLLGDPPYGEIRSLNNQGKHYDAFEKWFNFATSSYTEESVGEFCQCLKEAAIQECIGVQRLGGGTGYCRTLMWRR